MPRLVTLAVRDLLLGGFTAALWIQLLHPGTPESVTVLQVFAGLLTVLVGYLLHEWGHLTGALLTRSIVHLPNGAFSSPFLFRFDTGLNSRRQFLAMSLGGFVASALVVTLLVVLLPLQLPAARIALGLTALGVVATFVLELPPAWRVYRGGDMPGGSAFVHTRNPP